MGYEPKPYWDGGYSVDPYYNGGLPDEPVSPVRANEFLTLDEYKNPPGPVQEKWGPPPPTFHATNVGGTAQRWGQEGKDYTFLAESPQAMEEARQVGAPKVMKGYRDEDVKYGPEPKPGELDEMQTMKSLWKAHVDQNFQGRDPLTINPAEVGRNKRDELTRKELGYLIHKPGSADYKEVEKRIEAQVKEAEKAAEWQRKIGEEDHRMALDFFKKALKKEQGEAPKPQTRANVQGAQEYTRKILNSPGAYNLHPEDAKKTAADPNYLPKRSQLKEEALLDVNQVRELAGLPPVVLKQTQIPMDEITEFPWPGGWEINRKPTTPEPGYAYGYAQNGPGTGAPGQRTASMSQRPGQVSMPSMPPASSAPGRIIRDTVTGRRFKSNGQNWTEIK